MAMYRYEAISADGKTVTGVMEAASSSAVVQQLRETGHIPVTAEEKPPAMADGFAGLSASDKLSLREITFFTQELSILLKAGLSMEQALEMLLKLAASKRLSDFCTFLLSRIRVGDSLSQALAASAHPPSSVYISMVRAGEMGGAAALDDMLARLSDYLAKAQQIRESLTTTLLYPAILVAVTLISLIIIFAFVIPEFEPLFASNGAVPPASAAMLLGISHLFSDYGLVLAVVFGAALAACGYALKQEAMRDRFDRFVAGIPYAGQLLTKIEGARFCHTLAALHASRVPLGEALAIATAGLGNSHLRAQLEKAAMLVREGAPLWAALEKFNLFPSLLRQLVRLGEETGQLDKLLAKTADIYDRDVQRSLTRMVTLAAPVITVFMGTVIAGIIMTVLSAILSINELPL